ncbi:PAS domain-containing protein [Roseomonas eburnea]|uniref:histidine kinase n=1 Tax=Neoroseomonas eburnea TaxID=1346889 RepID=A0A9X9XA70_9PROT|nr:PAS domain-containing protein [Neoroseomonas eburnea]MBR0680606.1 PAS domain-containing protein [Neoroseomonas eburnea]
MPSLLIVAGLGLELRRQAQAVDDRKLVSAASVAALRVDAEINGRRLALQAFGNAIDGARSLADLPGTDAAARRLAEALGSPVGLLDRGLGLLVDTSHPFGTPLASTPAVAAGLWAIETGRASVSDVLPGPGGAAVDPLLLLPVLREGRTETVLSLVLASERLAEALGPGHALLLDGRGRTVAAQRGSAADLPEWPVILTAPRATVREGTDAAGNNVRFAIAFLREAPEWRVVAWEPAAVPAAVRRLVPWLCAAVFLAVAGALLAMRWTRRVLAAPIATLEDHALETAEALRTDAPVPPPPPSAGPAEFAALGAALAEAQAAAQDRERRLRALAEAGALVLWRADAAGGWTEAAGWAGLTGQTPPGFRGDGWVEMLHPDDRAPTLAEWGRCLVARSQIGVEFRLRNADEAGSWRWVRATGVPIAAEDGRLVEWVGAIHDVTDARGAGAAHRVNEAQVRQTVAELRAVYDTVPVGLALVDASLRFLNVNARFAAISGLPTEAHIGRSPHEVMPDGLAGPLEAAQREVLATGRPVLDVTCAGQAPGAVQHLRHWLASCHPVKDAEGAITGVSAVMQDVTERVRAERSRELLVTELNHRVKNTLARVQSIAAQSLRRAGNNSVGFGRDFVGRLQALTRGHDLLAEYGKDPVDLARVVRAGLAPWLEGGRPIRLVGSGRIQVDAAQAQALVLALHELVTNATKFGALSRAGGEVDVNWSVGEDGVVAFEWRERGGPPVVPPPAERRGFGLRVLERGLTHDLGPGAEVSVLFPEDGVRAVIRFRVGLPAPVEETAATS